MILYQQSTKENVCSRAFDLLMCNYTVYMPQPFIALSHQVPSIYIAASLFWKRAY